MQVGAQNAQRRACDVRAFRPSFRFACHPLVVGLAAGKKKENNPPQKKKETQRQMFVYFFLV